MSMRGHKGEGLVYRVFSITVMKLCTASTSGQYFGALNEGAHKVHPKR